MKHYLVLIAVCFCFYSCGTTKSSKPTSSTHLSNKIVANAMSYIGTPYVYVGISESGMDCSGIIYTSFLKEKILLPRVSTEMAKQAKNISLKKVKIGDVLFFKTTKSFRKINHVGLVVSLNNNSIKFIHATTSKGVIVSSLQEKYWKKAFVKAATFFK
ncbi:C40 family peptidase [Polaribacter tangerinus]|uniref:C40 family peptidase n=1 Tax=Polaribacter tangerinus TaxID=1920034 RepID=UPI000B4BCCB3|nr:C40 family peptidase [Polaribacter tangerinus]